MGCLPVGERKALRVKISGRSAGFMLQNKTACEISPAVFRGISTFTKCAKWGTSVRLLRHMPRTTMAYAIRLTFDFFAVTINGRAMPRSPDGIYGSLVF